MPYVWEAKSGRYRDSETGRFVGENVVKNGVENVAAQASANMRALAAKYRETPTMSLADFQTAMMQEVKTAHVATALAAAGGAANMTQSAWGYAGALIRQQYGYLQAFVQDVVDGKQALNGRFDARAAAYGAAVRATFENIRRRQQADIGYQFERNILHANESCNECRDASARGWVYMGTLPPIGARTCRSNCRCTISYRERFVGDVADEAQLEEIEAA